MFNLKRSLMKSKWISTLTSIEKTPIAKKFTDYPADSVKLSIAKEFTDYPGGRTKEGGDGSGEEFRETLLYPKIMEAKENNSKLYISIVGVRSFTYSFLEESFGGLIRVKVLTAEDVKDHIEIEIGTDEPGNKFYKNAIYRCIDDAAQTVNKLSDSAGTR